MYLKSPNFSILCSLTKCMFGSHTAQRLSLCNLCHKPILAFFWILSIVWVGFMAWFLQAQLSPPLMWSPRCIWMSWSKYARRQLAPVFASSRQRGQDWSLPGLAHREGEDSGKGKTWQGKTSFLHMERKTRERAMTNLWENLEGDILSLSISSLFPKFFHSLVFPSSKASQIYNYFYPFFGIPSRRTQSSKFYCEFPPPSKLFKQVKSS